MYASISGRFVKDTFLNNVLIELIIYDPPGPFYIFMPAAQAMRVAQRRYFYLYPRREGGGAHDRSMEALFS